MAKGTALITGASMGIGQAFAEKLLREGYHVVAVARNGERLKELQRSFQEKYDAEFIIIVRDLSIQAEVEQLYEEVSKRKIMIDLLINNAGFGVHGEFVKTDLAVELNMIDLNIKSVTHLTKLVLPDMLKRNKGKILNVASTAAFQAGPLMSVYYATKAYVLSFTEALANELKHTAITVSALCPGPTQTGFAVRANFKESSWFQKSTMDVHEVVGIGYRELMKGTTVIVPGLKNQMLTKMHRFLPRKIVTQFVRKAQETRLEEHRHPK